MHEVEIDHIKKSLTRRKLTVEQRADACMVIDFFVENSLFHATVSLERNIMLVRLCPRDEPINAILTVEYPLMCGGDRSGVDLFTYDYIVSSPMVFPHKGSLSEQLITMMMFYAERYPFFVSNMSFGRCVTIAAQKLRERLRPIYEGLLVAGDREVSFYMFPDIRVGDDYRYVMVDQNHNYVKQGTITKSHQFSMQHRIIYNAGIVDDVVNRCLRGEPYMGYISFKEEVPKSEKLRDQIEEQFAASKININHLIHGIDAVIKQNDKIGYPQAEALFPHLNILDSAKRSLRQIEDIGNKHYMFMVGFGKEYQ